MKNERRMPEARSCRNGIIFVSGLTNQLVVKSYFNDETNTIEITKRWYESITLHREIDDDLIEPITSKEKVEIALVQKIGWCINAILIIYSLLIAKNILYLIAALFYSSTVAKYLYRFIYRIFKIKIIDGIEKKTARYHSAEHMVINAYKQLNRVPSLEELKGFSRFNEMCGFRILVSKFIETIPIALAIAFMDKISIIGYFLICIISIILSKRMRNKDFIKVEQILVTESPTDLELKVAIKGLEALIEEEKEIQKEIQEAINIMKLFRYQRESQ